MANGVCVLMQLAQDSEVKETGHPSHLPEGQKQFTKLQNLIEVLYTIIVIL